MNPKFIIQERKLIIGKCVYHKELADPEKPVNGGGWFRFDNETDTFTFYGRSEDFGEAHIADIQDAIDNDKVFTNRLSPRSVAKKYKFVYDTRTELIQLN
jgi:hypothetical protein